jgi:hypothetical protein
VLVQEGPEPFLELFFAFTALRMRTHPLALPEGLSEKEEVLILLTSTTRIFWRVTLDS